MKKASIKIVVVGILISASSFVCYASGPGTTAANFLKIGVGAKATAMGGAFTALADDGTSLYWNPAGLAEIENREISATYHAHFQEIRQGYLSLALPLLRGTVGLGVNYVDVGKIEGRDEYGKPTGDFGAWDIQVSLAYARKFSSRLMLGMSAGMLQDMIAGDKKVAYLGNIGVLFKPTELLSAGVACQNIGSKLGKDPLPLTYRGGIALRLRSISIEADAVKSTDDDMYSCVGLEGWIGNILALRVGYRTGQDVGSGVSFGTGFKISNVQLGYAYVPYADLGNTHRISLDMEF